MPVASPTFFGVFRGLFRFTSARPSRSALNRHPDHVFVFRAILAGLAIAFCAVFEALAQQELSLGIVTGVVVDGATGAPLGRVLVEDVDSSKSVQPPPPRRAITGSDGRFTLELPSGPRRLRASVVGYAVAVKDAVVPAAQSVDVTIALAGGTSALSETVTVTLDHFRYVDPGAPAQQVLGSADIQNLRGVLADDPLRAVQALPGVATGDDLRSEFSVRGSSFSHMHLTVDGFSTPYLLHAVRAVEDASSSGSIAMINSDILQEVALVSGGYQQRSGNRTGASVEFAVRPGARDRVHVRTAVSGTNASIVAEGPLGQSKRGAWLVSARQSYLDLLIERLVDDQVKFGFTDAQTKFVYDLSPGQQVELSLLAGRSRLKEPDDQVDANDLYLGYNASTVGIVKWRRSGSRSVVSAGLLGGLNRFRNETIGGVELDRGRERQLTFRADARRSVSRAIDVEAGGDVDAFHETRHRERPVTATTFRAVNDYSTGATRTGAYASLRWSPTPSVTVHPGARVDRWTLTRQTTASPWLQMQWRVSSSATVRGAAGRYQQFPHFEQVVGAWAGVDLQPEQATHFDLGIEQIFRRSARLQLTVYDREERDMLRRPGAETRLLNGALRRGSTEAIFENRLDGHARGVEVMLQRLDSSGLSGWISYSYARNRYRDRVSGEAFWGDLDQRHTLNVYGLYRLSPRTSVSVKLRTGSNFPAPGYFREVDGRHAIADVRNLLRLPSYARLDLRANRTFSWTDRRLTLFAEVINVLNRENVRYHPPSVDGRTFEARRLFEPLMPVIPSAGVLIEF
jgi:hypothetical protein